jgi:hypothetical protein
VSILRPTKNINDVLTEFLLAQEKRLSRNTYQKYESIIYYLRRSLNEYGYMGLNERDRNRFEWEYENKRNPNAFVELFGPQEIVENLGEFSYFMDCKVIDSKGVMNAADTVINRLTAWLEECGYARLDEEDDENENENENEKLVDFLDDTCPPVPPETDEVFDERLVPLPDLCGSPQDVVQAAELRAGFVRWIGQVPARPVLLVLTCLRDAHWWLDHRDRLFTEIATRLGPHSHLLNHPPSPPHSWTVKEDQRTICSQLSPESALYPTGDEAIALYLNRVRRGLVLRQSFGEKDGEVAYLRVVKYLPPEEEIHRFAVIEADFDEQRLTDFLAKRDAYAYYEWGCPANAELLFDETDIPAINDTPFKPFHPCKGDELVW